MKQWHDILRKAVEEGESRLDRTGVGTYSVFGEMLKFENVDSQFPAVTTKQLAFKQVAAELAGFVRGYDNLEQFHELGCKIWDANGNADYWQPRSPGDLGRIYGVQWRDWKSCVPGGIKVTDQLYKLVQGLIIDPYSRRHIVTAWNPGELDQMCLPPCHTMFQASVRWGAQLDFCVTMRSVDLFLGLPFDIASYALLMHLVAEQTQLSPGTLTFMLGDAHVYRNHLDAVQTVLTREPGQLPQLTLDKYATLSTFHPDQASLVGYQHQGKVEAEMAV